MGYVYKTLGVEPNPNTQIYLAFIEQLTRLANRKQCAGALVLPLSIACNTGLQFTTARELIQATAGRWRFAFFDREPHALFGEDVKTRNSILIWSRHESDTHAVVATGPLRKWRGECRAPMFNSIRFTVLNRDIRTGIPKVDGAPQASALEILSGRHDCLEQAAERIGKHNLADTWNADDQLVFVGPTAYNFLNVFLRPPLPVLKKQVILSENPFHAIRCASAKDAFAVFAILTSHLAYWWWHTHGDGFHVSKTFISKFPFSLRILGDSVTNSLACGGRDLWSAIRSNPIISMNRGRTSFAYPTNGL